MAHVIAIANEKGGVAKTTTTHTLAHALTSRGKRILLIDADAQGNLTETCGYDGEKLADDERTLAHLLAGNVDIGRAIVGEDPSLIGSNSLLMTVNDALVKSEQPPTRLRAYLRDIQDSFDYILIDCGPGITQATLNALGAADYVLIPAKLDERSVTGIGRLFVTIQRFKEVHNPRLRILGILPTIYDKGYASERDYLHQLKHAYQFKAPVFDPVPRTGWINNKLTQAKSILSSRPSAVSAQSYERLADRVEELVNRPPLPSHEADVALNH